MLPLPAAAINDIKAELHATDQEISLSLSLFLLFQGVMPLLWSALSEIRGRKVPLVSLASRPLIPSFHISLSTWCPYLYDLSLHLTNTQAQRPHG